MGEFLLESQFFGLFLSLAFFQLARWLNRKAGREVISPLLFATLLCIAVLLVFDIDFEVYNRGAQYLDVLLTPATICLAIPLYRQYELLRRNAVAVLAGSVAGVAAHMAGCLLMLAVFRMEAAEFITLLPKSITTAIGMGVSEEAGGIVTLTVVSIIITGVSGVIMSEGLFKLFKLEEPIAKGLALGNGAHAIGTSKALELGEVEGAMSSLAIAVAGLMTVIVVPLIANLI